MRLVAAFLVAVLVSGCFSSDEGVPVSGSEVPAKFGLSQARSAVFGVAKDAYLVGVRGSSDKGGLSGQWDYYFDSVLLGRGYIVSYPGYGMMETSFSYKGLLDDSWVDSPQAAAACGGVSGKFSLESMDGGPFWTVALDERDCVVDALSGKAMAEPA
jgi:hypothetical protein